VELVREEEKLTLLDVVWELEREEDGTELFELKDKTLSILMD
jgi:hypothetical protein